MATTTDRIKNVMSAVFEMPADQINESASTDSIELWDSLRHLNLIIALEEEFGISIPHEEVGNLVNFKLVEITVNELYK